MVPKIDTEANPKEIGYFGLLLAMLIVWLGEVAWHSWTGIDPIHAAVGMGIIVGMGGVACRVIWAFQALRNPSPLLVGAILSNTVDSLGGRTLGSVALTSAVLGVSLLVSFSLIHWGFSLARRSAAAKKSQLKRGNRWAGRAPHTR